MSRRQEQSRQRFTEEQRGEHWFGTFQLMTFALLHFIKTFSSAKKETTSLKALPNCLVWDNRSSNLLSIQSCLRQSTLLDRFSELLHVPCNNPREDQFHPLAITQLVRIHYRLYLLMNLELSEITIIIGLWR